LDEISQKLPEKKLKKSFGLVRAEDSKVRQSYEVKPVSVQRVQYGRSETKRAITNVLNSVLTNYKFSSLPELNAVLKQYNVLADRGSENSRIFQNNGLVYRVVDSSGNKIGVPVKATDFYNKPTLKFLETKFASNETAKQPFKSRVKNAIDLALLKQKNIHLNALIKVLEKEGIHVALRQNSEGIIYGITYVDHKTKCVFNGSDLGKQYSAKAIQERCSNIVQAEQTLTPQRREQQQTVLGQSTTHSSANNVIAQPVSDADKSLLEILLQAEGTSSLIPYPLTGKGRKKKKKSKSKNL